VRLLCCLALVLTASGGRAADWSLKIAPLPGKLLPSVVHVGDPATIFQVLLANDSKRTLLIWKDWCSFGYFNLYYQVTRRNGQSFELRRMGGSWTWNFPDGQEVVPGQVVSLDGSLAPKLSTSGWGDFPADWKNGETVELRAVYENRVDRDEVEMFTRMAAKQRKQLIDHPPENEKLQKLLLSHVDDPPKHYLSAWMGKVISPPITVVMDQKLNHPPGLTR